MPETCTITVIDKSGLEVVQNEKLFCSLYERFFDKMFNHALFYCTEKQLAEDCVQDVFLKLWQNLQQIQLKIDGWKNWHFYLFVMTRNEANNLMKKRNSVTLIENEYSSLETEIIYHDRILEKECDRILMDAMAGLTKQQRRIFILQYCGFKPRAIAKELAIARITVRNTLWTARKIIANYVESEFCINESLIKLANAVCA